jgi:hypothetical protein
MTTDNGLSLTGEQDPSEPLPTESKLCQSKTQETTGTTMATQLLLSHTREKLSKRSDGSQEMLETSEILV